MKKRWYDYLWIASSVYFLFGFVNILFAWLGLVCFFLPLIISVAGGGKAYCNRYCGRGQLFALLGGRLGLSRKKDPPKFLRSKWFRYGFLAFFFIMFFQMLWNTWLVFEGAQGLHQVVKLLWTIKLPWQWAYHGETVAPWACRQRTASDPCWHKCAAVRRKSERRYSILQAYSIFSGRSAPRCRVLKLPFLRFENNAACA